MQEVDGKSVLSSRRLRSCGLGCLVSLVLLVGLIVGLYYWAVTPGPQIPGDSFVGRETVGVAYLSGLHEDPAFAATVQECLRTLQAFNSTQVQASNSFLFRMFAGRRRTVGEQDVEKAIRDVPRDLALLIEQPPDTSEPGIAVVANLNRFPRGLHLLYSVAALIQGSESYRGYRILRLGKGDSPSVAFIEDTLIWAQKREVLQLVLERYLNPESSATAATVRALRLRSERWNLYGTVDNRDDLLTWLIERSPDSWWKGGRPENLESALEKVESMDFGLDVTSDGSLEGFINARLDTPEHASELRTLIIDEWFAPGTQPAPLQIEESEDSRALRGTFHLGDLDRRLQRALEEVKERRGNNVP